MRRWFPPAVLVYLIRRDLRNGGFFMSPTTTDTTPFPAAQPPVCYCCEIALGRTANPYKSTTCPKHWAGIAFRLFRQLIGTGHMRRLLTWRPDHVLRCSWCWRDAGLQSAFPAHWTSGVCHQHARWMWKQARLRQRHRQHLRKPVAAGSFRAEQEESKA